MGRVRHREQMKNDLTEIERLDCAARAKAAGSTLRYQTWFLSVMALIFVLVVSLGKAAPLQTLAMRVLASIVVLAALMSWFPIWRYTMYPTAILYFGLAIMELGFGSGHSDSPFAWIEPIGLGLGFATCGYALLTRYTSSRLRVPSAAFHGKAWEKERAQVRQWFTELINQGTEEQVFEISTGNFWTGYFTYRFMRRDNAWVVARFKKGNLLRPLEYRVLASAAFAITPLLDGTFYVQIDKRKIREAVVPLHMRESLLRAIGTS